MVITIKNHELLFRMILTIVFLICLFDLITSAKIFLYNNLIAGRTLTITCLGMIISFEEIMYVYMFMEYFKQVTKGVDDEKITKRKEN